MSVYTRIITLKCQHDKTVYINDKNGFTVAAYRTGDSNSVPGEARNKFQPQDGTIAFTAIGIHLPTTSGAEITLTGKWADTKKGTHEKQFSVESASVSRPQTTAGIIAYLTSDLIKGIGDVTAKAIVDKFGVQTLDIIDEEPRRLLEVPGISEKKLAGILATYNENNGLQEIMTQLAEYGVTPKKAAKIQAKYGAQAVDTVRANPYVLCAIHGFGFKTVDEMAIKKGIPHNNPTRVKEGIMYTLSESQLSGHLYLTVEGICNNTAELTKRKRPKGADDLIVDKTEIQNALLALVTDRRLIEENGRIYLSKNHIAEDETARLAKAMIKPTPVKGDVKHIIAQTEAKIGIELADMQREAVYTAITNNFSIITGGPGTGKTTVIKTLYRAYKALVGGEVLFAAPTGRAARRLSESVGAKAATLHSLLGLSTEINAESRVKITADFVIVDETSMMEMALAHQLFKNLGSNTKLLLVGDYEQLPSVGAGNVFKEMLLCGSIPVTRLDTVYRQASSSRIHLNAHSILKNDTSLQYGTDFAFVACETPEEAAEAVKEIYFESIKQPNKNGKAYGVDGVQILSPLRGRGKCCVNELNKDIQTYINPKSANRPNVTVGYNNFRLYDKVMQTKNKGEISNGDVGRIRQILKEEAGYQVSIDFGGDRKALYSVDDMDSIDLAYATTIHKSQGSEYPIVIVPILTEAYIMLQRNLIYTAITRAKEKVILVGQKKALFIAIHKAEIADRNSVLGKRIAHYYASAQRVS